MTLASTEPTPWEEPSTWLREPLYALAFRRGLERHRRATPRAISPTVGTPTGATPDELWRSLCAALPKRSNLRTLELDLAGKAGQRAREYWRRFSRHYRKVGAAREKALEHALTFELMDLSRARRYCDVASAKSPIQHALRAEYPALDLYRQDLLYETDLSRRIIGGYAQNMTQIADGFFDALALHCSFEHFAGNSDVEFVSEVDRVLGSRGACLILPLYMANEHRVYFDPSIVPPGQLASYDDGARLCAAWHYRQHHGRFYSPESLGARLLAAVPSGLSATLLHFVNGQSIDPSVYLRFGLVLHRPESILTI